MTRVLLERFIVHRPHPWGALVTFIELFRNQKYELWSKEFVRVAPEVTMLLESECSCVSLHPWFLMSWSGREIHLSILDSLCLLSLLSVAHIFSLWVLFSLAPQFPVSFTFLPCLFLYPQLTVF